MSQQSQRAGQRQVEDGPELLRAAPAQVMKTRLVGKMGMRPVLNSCAALGSHEVLLHYFLFALLQSDSPKPEAFHGICYEMAGLDVAATTLGLRCPGAV